MPKKVTAWAGGAARAGAGIPGTATSITGPARNAGTAAAAGGVTAGVKKDDAMSYCWGHDPPVPAAYLWTSARSGNQVSLCAVCCADWRARAQDDTSLAPARIRSLEPWADAGPADTGDQSWFA